MIASGADMFAMAVGTPAELVARAKAAGQLTLSLIGSPRHVERTLAAGVDLLVAQGYDAGAHTGTIGTLSLVPQVLGTARDVPVIAAGGIATGSQFAAALAMGAQGVWTGTIWLASEEHALDPILTEQLLRAGSEDTVISRSWSGTTLRMVRSGWSDEWSAPGAPAPLKMPCQQVLVGELNEAVNEHRIESLMWTPAGQSVAYLKEVRSVDEIMAELVEQTEQAIDRLAALRNWSLSPMCELPDARPPGDRPRRGTGVPRPARTRRPVSRPAGDARTAASCIRSMRSSERT